MNAKYNDSLNKVPTAYLLWLGCLFQLYGLHRLYNGKILTGLLWMFSFGLFGVGQLVDLLLIPNLVQEHNDKLKAKYGLLPAGALPPQAAIERVTIPVEPIPPTIQPLPTIQPPIQPLQISPLVMDLLKTAEARGGKLSVTQGVMATGASFVAVEAALLDIVRTGYAEIVNHPETGVVMYEFKEL